MKKYLRRRPGPSRQCNNSVEYSNDDEEDDGTTCKIYKIPWIELTEKCGDWVQCNIRNEYISPKCYGKKDISPDDDFFCSVCIRS